jgi:hypothetical protein
MIGDHKRFGIPDSCNDEMQSEPKVRTADARQQILSPKEMGCGASCKQHNW